MKKSILMLTVALGAVSGVYAEGDVNPNPGVSGSGSAPAATHVCFSKKQADAIQVKQANMVNQMDSLVAKLETTEAQLAAAKVRKAMTQAQNAVNKGLKVAVGGAPRRARNPKGSGGNKTAPKRKRKRSGSGS